MTCFFFFNDTATTEIYTLSLHDALPILAVDVLLSFGVSLGICLVAWRLKLFWRWLLLTVFVLLTANLDPRADLDRKSTRLNSSHGYISYAVFCLKKKSRMGRSRHAWAGG